MKKNVASSTSWFVILLVSGMVSGCGVFKVADKMDDTNSKLDQSNAHIKEMKDDTKDKLGQTNSNTKDLKDKIDATNSEIKKTNLAIHSQTLVIALDNMMKPENTRYLFPPTGMLPAGEAFAQVATADEIVKLAYVWLKEIDEAQPDEAEKVPDGHGGAEFPPSLRVLVDKQKFTKLTGLEVICGLAPQSTIEKLIQEQIVEGGRYEITAYTVLMMRAQFISEILIKEGLMSHRLVNPGLISETIDRVLLLESMTTLPFAGRIEIKIHGMLNPEDNEAVNGKLDLGITRAFWQRLGQALETELDPRFSNDPRLESMRSVVRSHLGPAHS